MEKVEIEDLTKLKRFINMPQHNWALAVLQGVDLTTADIEKTMLSEPISAKTTFLGCRMSTSLAAKIYDVGSLVIPPREGLPFDPFRGSLYSPTDLFVNYQRENEDTYLATPDWQSYLAAMDESIKRKRSDLGVDDIMFFRLHDLSIEDALYEYLKPDPADLSTWKKVVGIMGGHDLERLEKVKDSDGRPTAIDFPYMQVALLAWKLSSKGFTIVTGGGPGAMEAGNLGAWFANRSESELRAAVNILEKVPKIKPKMPGGVRWNSGEWLAPAFEVIEQFPRDTMNLSTESLGVPTWFYGHEPPNPFASHTAKYFENSLREEGLLAIANYGVVFAEGNAGTVQEIFQDAGQNYYLTYGAAAPMVLLGSRYWNRGAFPDPGPKDKPLWPLLQKIGAEKSFGHLQMLTDDIDAAVSFISYPPQTP